MPPRQSTRWTPDRTVQARKVRPQDYGSCRSPQAHGFGPAISPDVQVRPPLRTCRGSGTAAQADLDEAAQLVGELDVTVVDSIQSDPLPGFLAVDGLCSRTFFRQHATKLTDHLLQARHVSHLGFL